MPLFPRSRARELLRAAAPPAALLLAAFVLVRFPPEHFAFYPRCPIHLWLHVLCPGCGTTRALASLLHLHVRQALRHNALTTLLLPPALFWGLCCYRRWLTRKPLPHLPAEAIFALLATAAVFTAARNL